jgi:hypothetical protein
LGDDDDAHFCEEGPPEVRFCHTGDDIVNYKGSDLKFKAKGADWFYQLPNQVALELKPVAAIGRGNI